MTETKDFPDSNYRGILQTLSPKRKYIFHKQKYKKFKKSPIYIMKQHIEDELNQTKLKTDINLKLLAKQKITFQLQIKSLLFKHTELASS